MKRSDPSAIPEIAGRLRLFRKAVAKNQTELCTRTGITRAAWSNYENARDRIGLDAAMKLCRTYGVTLDWIYFGGENSPDHLIKSLRQAEEADPETE